MMEISALMKRAEKSLRSAATLLAEEDFGSSVSRSYYAMLYAAEATLLTKKLKFRSHRAVQAQFNKHFVKTGLFGAEMARRLRDAYDLRLTGDYQYDVEVTRDQAAQAQAWAREFVGEVKMYLEKAVGGSEEN